jgi:5'-nucleotidase
MPRSAAPLLLIGLLLASAAPTSAEDLAEPWPRRVLITNDNGLDDPKIVALARAFAPVAETWVVAPLEDRRGSTHYLSVTRAGQLRAQPRDLGAGVRAWAVDGFPADAVLLALFGLMKDSPPDLVVSGINGGPNLAHDWLGSGTIGAARIAAYLGVPAIAVSGLDDDIPGAVEAATRWVVELARSPAVRALEPGQYLTVSMPRRAPSEIVGVRVARRAGLQVDVAFTAGEPAAGGGDQIWRIAVAPSASRPDPATDAGLYEAGYIVVVPMHADEHDDALLRELLEGGGVPEWTPGVGLEAATVEPAERPSPPSGG